MTKNKKKLRRVEKRYSVTKSAQTLVLAGMLLAGGVTGAMAAQAELSGSITTDTAYANSGGYQMTGTSQLLIGTHTATFTTADGLTVNRTGGHDGILGYGPNGYTGKVVFDTGFGTGTINSGSAIGAAVIDIKAGAFNLSGSRAPENATEAAWRTGSIIVGDQGVNVSGGTVNLADKTLLTAGFAGSDTADYKGINVTGGKVVLAGTGSADNASLLVASSAVGAAIPDAKHYTTLKIAGGTVEVSASNYGVIASRDTTISSGTLDVKGSLLMVGAMAEDATKTGFAAANQESKSKLTLNGTGKIDIAADASVYAPYMDIVQNDAGSNFTVKGEFYTEKPGSITFPYSSSSYTLNNGTLTIAGDGTKKATLQVGNLAIKGGTVEVGDTSTSATSNWAESPTLGAYGVGNNNHTDITGGTITLGNHGVLFAGIDDVGTGFTGGQLNINNGAKLLLDGTATTAPSVIYAASSAAYNPATVANASNYAVTLNISGKTTAVTVNSTKEGYILSRETNLSGGALLDVQGSLTVAGRSAKSGTVAAGITGDNKGGVFNVNEDGTVKVTTGAGKLDFHTGEVDLNVNGGTLTAGGLSVGAKVATAGWVSAKDVHTTKLDLSGSGTGTGTGINVGQVDIAAGGTFTSDGALTLAEGKLAATPVANGVSVASGGAFVLNNVLTLTDAAADGVTATIGGDLSVQGIDAKNTAGTASAALTWNGGNLNIMGQGDNKAFSNATSLTIGTGTMTLGTAAGQSGSYGHNVAVTDKLNVAHGDWELKGGTTGVTVGSSGNMNVNGGTLTVDKLVVTASGKVNIGDGSTITGGKLIITDSINLNNTASALTLNGSTAGLDAGWNLLTKWTDGLGDITTGLLTGITGTKGTITLTGRDQYTLAQLKQAATGTGGAVVISTGDLVKADGGAVTEVASTDLGAASVGASQATLTNSGSIDIKGVNQSILFKDVDMGSGTTLAMTNGASTTLLGTGSGELIKTTNAGGVTVALGATNNAGTLKLGDTNVTGTQGGNITGTIKGGGTVDGIVELTKGNYTLTGNLGGITGTDGNLTVNAGASVLQVGGIVAVKNVTANTAGGGLTSTGNMTISNSATVTGGTVSTDGTLNLSNGGSISSGTLASKGNMTVTSALTVNTAADADRSKTVIGSTDGSLTLTGGFTDGAGTPAPGAVNNASIIAGTGMTVITGGLNGSNVALQVTNGNLTVSADGLSLVKGSTATINGDLLITGDVSVKESSTLAAKNLDLAAGEDLNITDSAAVHITEKLTASSTSVLNVGTGGEEAGTLYVQELATVSGSKISVDPVNGNAFMKVASLTGGKLAAQTVVGNNGILSVGSRDKAWVLDQVRQANSIADSVLVVNTPVILDSGGQLLTGPGFDADAKSPTFGQYKYGSTYAALDANNALSLRGNSLFIAEVNTLGTKSLISLDSTKSGVHIDNTAGIRVVADKLARDTKYTLVSGIGSLSQADGIGGANVTKATSGELTLTGGTATTNLMVGIGNVNYTVGAGNTGTLTATTYIKSANSVIPHLSDEMGRLMNTVAYDHTFDTQSPNKGIQFVSRAIDSRFLNNAEHAAATIEGAAQLAVVGAVPAMTLAAVQSGTSAVTTRTSFASPLFDSSKAVALHKDTDGTVSIDSGLNAGSSMKNGFGLWIMPLYQSNSAWGMKADNFKGGYKSDLGGVALGADYTINDMFRFGLAFNIGGGYAESSGDFNKTDNSFSFWGINAYGGWTMNNFGLTADVGYTGNYNKVKQELPGSMVMDDIKSDVTSSAWTAGLRGEYKFATEALDIIPHVGVRYTGLTTDEYKAKSGGDTVFKVDQDFQNIWTFPIGVTFAKEIETSSGWIVRPQVDLGITPATGDVKAKSKVRIPGVDGNAEMKMQVVDYMSYDGGVGLEMKKDNISFGINYNIQASEHRTGHGVFGTLRYEF